MVLRTMVDVDGATEALASVLADGAPQHAARRLRDLAGELDLRDAREATIAEGRSVLLATGPSGAVLALRWFAPGASTTIHEHGSWGAACVVEGRDRYERFERCAGGAAVDATLWLEAGDVVWWLDPPHDVHRQTGIDGGALELIVVGAEPSEHDAIPEVDGLGAVRALVGAVRAAFEQQSFEPLRTHYDADVIADACIPAWRFQAHGRDAVDALLSNEELGLPGQRLQSFRAFPMSDGAVVETAVRFRHGDETRQWRDLHVLRTRRAKIVEHLVYCTGHWDAETISRHDAVAPLVRP